jgi:hypothetical protein
MKQLNIDPAHSNKPSAIEYRLKRAHSAVNVAQQFLNGVDADLFGVRLLEARRLATELEAVCADIRSTAPQKRVHVKRADKPAPAPKGKRGRPRKVRPVETLDTALEAVEAQLAAEPAAEIQNAAE